MQVVGVSGCVNSYGTQFDYALYVQGNTTQSFYGPTRVEIRLWGDDEWYDDFLRGPFISYQDWSNVYYGISCGVARAVETKILRAIRGRSSSRSAEGRARGLGPVIPARHRCELPIADGWR